MHSKNDWIVTIQWIVIHQKMPKVMILKIDAKYKQKWNWKSKIWITLLSSNWTVRFIIKLDSFELMQFSFKDNLKLKSKE